MKSRLMRVVATGALALALAAGAQAGPFADFEAELRAVYAPYRNALFATNQKNAANSEKTVEAFARGWAKLADKWRSAPPPQYVDDPRFAETMDRIDALVAGARKQIAAGDFGEAHEALEKIRNELGALRQRNQVRSYSDLMNEYHVAMEHMTSQKAESGPAALAVLRDRAAVLVFLAEKLASAQPPEAKDRPDFAELTRAVVASAKALHAAAAAGDPAAVQAALGALKKPYAMLFVNFG